MNCRSLVCLLLIQFRLLSCSSRNRITGHWVWDYVAKPQSDGDGFLHLARAAQLFEEEGALTDAVRSNLELASASIRWSGSPDMQDVAFRFSGYRSAESLSNGTTEVNYGVLRNVLRAYIHGTSQANGDADSLETAAVLIRLGYQLSRNGEDDITGLHRLVCWREGFDRLHELGEIPADDFARINARIQEDFQDIFERNENKLHRLRKR